MNVVVPAFVRRFRLMGLLTVVAVYLLILVGGVVRSTGSGMGCPDWPKCFGMWVPPTDVHQLPSDYKEIYTSQRVAKNKKLALLLERLGFKQVAGNIFAHPTQYIETDFNATKTWIEYVNRLLGALIGIFVFLTVVFSASYWKKDRTVFWLAFWSWILTGVQGWLGSLVVSTNLLPIMVTIHMGLALVIVAMLIYAVDRSQKGFREVVAVAASPSLIFWLWLAIFLTFVQIIIGTQVREQVDSVAFTVGYSNRERWIEQLGSIFYFHRTFSILLLVVNVYVVYRLLQLRSKQLQRLAVGILALVGTEIMAGVTLASFAVPATVQPIHLTIATVLFGIQFLTAVLQRRATKVIPQATYPRVVA
ncbi:COX15/CtaA family protein [Hymenobacter sp. GOD-10R]|uniref:COX15/CtaA family protein n=1 Tax=Hymenobacter sp. GOD-10R TaxID=3093922 RepID=UPI002D7952E6|nr:COX15/CtaA family protein [Hymenobacter sp. GOD-10R]WRQ29831.1 COX15/CtaA family protein [Hymenobacter sp. GOD-10R]